MTGERGSLSVMARVPPVFGVGGWVGGWVDAEKRVWMNCCMKQKARR